MAPLLFDRRQFSPAKFIQAVLITLLLSDSRSWLLRVAAQDPCQTTLNEGHNNRSPLYIPDPFNDELLCDFSITTDWVRFDKVAPPGSEAKIPESFVDQYRCGTQVPIYMNGLHPTAANPGPITVQVCGKTSKTLSCGWSGNIQVKWCTPGYYVYKLEQPPFCDMAYCFDDTFTPPPEMPSLNTPVMSAPFISDSKDVHDIMGNPMQATVFSVTCTVGFSSQYTGNLIPCIEVNLATDEGILLLETGQIIKEPTGDTVVTFGEEVIAGHCGHTIKCSAVAYFDNNRNQRSLMKYSAGFWFGLVPESGQYDFQSPTPVALSEGQQMTMWLKSTFPVTARNCYENPDDRCYPAYTFTIDGSQEGGAKQQTCNLNLPVNAEGKTTDIIMSPFATVGIRRQPFLVLLRFLHFASLNVENSIFENYIIDPVPIYINDGTVRPICTTWGDPHITAFGSNVEYHVLYEFGDFYLLKNKNPGQTLEIQAQHRICNAAGIVCNCGVIAREGNNVLGINACKSSNGVPLVVRYLTANDPDVPDAAIITIAPNRWKIWLPSGIEIDITNHHHGYLNIYVYGLNDVEYTGLCAAGTNAGNYEQNRVLPENSLFRNLAKCVNEEYSVTPCSCKRQQNAVSICDNLVNEGSSAAAIVPAGRDICNKDGVEGKRRKRDLSNSNDVVVPDDWLIHTDQLPDPAPGVPIDPAWPTHINGITEEQARKACQDAMKISPAYDFCINNQLVDESRPLSTCMFDIQLTDDLGASLMYQDVIETLCVYQVKSRVVLQSDNGTITTPQDQQDMLNAVNSLTCPGQCAPGGIKRGTCNNGACNCDPGFADVDCSLAVNESPVITEILPKCFDYQQLNQADEVFTVLIHGKNIDRLGELACRATVDEGHPDPQLQMLHPSKFVSGMQVCYFKASNLQPGRLYTISISISNNNLTYSDKVPYTLYDGNCMNCDQNTGDSALKDGYIWKEEQCYNLPERSCPESFTSVEGHDKCFKVITQLTTWINAKERCSQLHPDSTLIVISSKEEQAALYSAISEQDITQCYNGKTYFHTSGQRQISGNCNSADRFSFVWRSSPRVNETVVGDLNYVDGEPNCYGGDEDCLAMFHEQQGYLNDIPCNHPACPLCQV